MDKRKRMIKIEVIDTMIAIDKMGKNKAQAVDELMDIIFQAKEMKNMERRLKKQDKLRNNWKNITYKKSEHFKDEGPEPKDNEREFVNHAKYIISRNLTTYLNHILEKED